MSRAIDADALSEWLKDYGQKVIKGEREASLMYVWKHVQDMPTVQPEREPQWIPCSETVDIPDHEILACDFYGEMMFGYLSYEDEQWMCASEQEVMYDPVAWREKPEPYGGEQDESDRCGRADRRL